jgi:phenylalanyl-tRNA synthetase beta chain
VHVGLLATGSWENDNWLRSTISVDYFLVKGLLDRLCAALHCSLDYTPAQEPFLHPGRSAVARDAEGNEVGWLGELHPMIVQTYELRPPAVAAELDVARLLAATRPVAFKDLLAYPIVEQDVALVLDSVIPAARVIETLKQAGGDLLEDISVFDVYEGTQIGAGQKSLALRLNFRAPDRTLSDAEVNQIRARMVDKASKELGAKLRT